MGMGIDMVMVMDTNTENGTIKLNLTKVRAMKIGILKENNSEALTENKED